MLAHVTPGDPIRATTINGLIDAVQGPSIPSTGLYRQTTAGSLLQSLEGNAPNAGTATQTFLELSPYWSTDLSCTCLAVQLYDWENQLTFSGDRLSTLHFVDYDTTEHSVQKLSVVALSVMRYDATASQRQAGENIHTDGFFRTELSVSFGALDVLVYDQSYLSVYKKNPDDTTFTSTWFHQCYRGLLTNARLENTFENTLSVQLMNTFGSTKPAGAQKLEFKRKGEIYVAKTYGPANLPHPDGTRSPGSGPILWKQMLIGAQDVRLTGDLPDFIEAGPDTNLFATRVAESGRVVHYVDVYYR